MTDRIPLDHLNSDQYDALCDQLDQARAGERELGEGVEFWHAIAVRHQHWGQRRWNAWKSARARARRQRDRAARAEAAIARVRAECARLQAVSVLATGEPHTDRERGVVTAVIRVLATLDEPAPGPCGASHPEAPSAHCDKPRGHTDGEHSGMTNYNWRATWPAEPAPAAGPAATQATDGGHVYLSTGCLHGEHGYCSNVDGIAGLKKPAQCKFCAAPCVCPCHTA